jgi:hypothetical protein
MFGSRLATRIFTEHLAKGLAPTPQQLAKSGLLLAHAAGLKPAPHVELRLLASDGSYVSSGKVSVSATTDYHEARFVAMQLLGVYTNE